MYSGVEHTIMILDEEARLLITYRRSTNLDLTEQHSPFSTHPLRLSILNSIQQVSVFGLNHNHIQAGNPWIAI